MSLLKTKRKLSRSEMNGKLNKTKSEKKLKMNQKIKMNFKCVSNGLSKKFGLSITRLK